MRQRLRAKFGSKLPSGDDREELQRRVGELESDNSKLRADVAALTHENAQLKAALLGKGPRPDEIDVEAFARCGVSSPSAAVEAEGLRECLCLVALAHAQAAQRAVTFFSLQDALLSQALDGARSHLDKLLDSLSHFTESYKVQLTAPLKRRVSELEKLHEGARKAEESTKHQFFALRKLTTKPVTIAMHGTTGMFVEAFNNLDGAAEVTAKVESLGKVHALVGAVDMATRQRNGASAEQARTNEFLQQLYAIGTVARGPLETLLATIGKEVGQGVEVQMGKLKGLERVFEKTMEEYEGDFSRLGDIVRGSLVCDGVAVVLAVLERLSAHCEAGGGANSHQPHDGVAKSFELVRIKNRLDPQFDAEAESGGYRDVLVNVVVGVNRATVFGEDNERGGKRSDFVFVVCEIQVHLRSFHDIKGAGGAHRLYKQARSLHLLDSELGQVFVRDAKEGFAEAMDLVERGACRGFSADYVEFDAAMATRLFAALQDHAVCSVTTLSLRGSSMGKIARELHESSVQGLREVVLSDNDGVGGAFVARFISKPLRVLRFRNCGLDQEGFGVVARRLRDVRPLGLRVLEYTGNNTGSGGAKEMAPTLKGLANLRELLLGRNEIGSEGAREFAPSLEVLTKLTALDLGGNNIGSVGAMEIAPSLKVMTELNVLSLGRNDIGRDGMAKLAPSLETLPNLTVLNLGRNDLEREGVRELAPSLKTLTSLRQLYLHDNDIGREGAKEIAPSLALLVNLTVLGLQGNSIGSDGAKEIAPSLKALVSLNELYLQGNTIGSEGAAAIAASLLALTNLRELYLQENNIGDDGATAVALSLKALSNLTVLDLRGNGDMQLLEASAPPGCKVLV